MENTRFWIYIQIHLQHCKCMYIRFSISLVFHRTRTIKLLISNKFSFLRGWFHSYYTTDSPAVHNLRQKIFLFSEEQIGIIRGNVRNEIVFKTSKNNIIRSLNSWILIEFILFLIYFVNCWPDFCRKGTFYNLVQLKKWKKLLFGKLII